MRSRNLQQRAEMFLPGGVDSPVRAFRAVGGDPPFVIRAEGPWLWDADGNRYIDYFGSWGPMILGHAAPHVVRAVQEAAAHGTSFGASTPTEADLAEMVHHAFPSVEMMRFVSSGTEAAMSAIRLARAFTGRKFFIKFEGCYHGHADALLVQAGSGIATLGIPGSAGVPQETVRHTLALPFNDVAAVEEAFARYPDEIACIIVEPVVGNAGCIPPQPGYLQALREITERAGALLIFDEVMTGFRLALGGAQELYGMQPDLTCLGKILGGGLPCGAFGGRADIMRMLAPLGPVYQAGTLSGNPLAMAAGLATLRTLEADAGIYDGLESYTSQLAGGLKTLAAEAGVPISVNQIGSMLTPFFLDAPHGTIRNYAQAARSDTATFGMWFQALLSRGIYWAPSQFESIFVSASHTHTELDATLEAARAAFGGLKITSLASTQEGVTP